MKQTLFVSDLHIDASQPEIAAQFIDFLERETPRLESLYILGDLFEVWLGDDDPDPHKRQVLAALARLTARGIHCGVMHGNRDFLIGARFCAETGCRLVPEGTVISLHGEPVLLMHGDALCTDDVSYQRLRRIVRNPFVRWLFDRMSLAQRQALARRLRAGSQEHVGRTAPAIMDVNAAAVTETLRRAGVRRLIHGHTHRPAVHTLDLDGTKAERIVLGDWYTQGSVLRVNERGYELEALPR